jgi:iron complex transport system ATP-binding protein
LNQDTPLIEFQNISIKRGERVALDRLTLRIGLGEHVAILGPNGCGKSTLIKAITRECYPLQEPGSSLRIMGKDRWNVFELRAMLGIVSNDLMAAMTRDFTAREVALSGFFSSVGIWPHQEEEITPAMRRKADKALDRLDALHLSGRWMDELSTGEARRVLLARSLVHEPKALILDEPSTALDLYGQHELREILRKLALSGVGIIMVTHHLSDLIPEMERVILLSKGSVAADGPTKEVLTEQRLSEVFGLPLQLSERNGYYNLW